MREDIVKVITARHRLWKSLHCHTLAC